MYIGVWVSTERNEWVFEKDLHFHLGLHQKSLDFQRKLPFRQIFTSKLILYQQILIYNFQAILRSLSRFLTIITSSKILRFSWGMVFLHFFSSRLIPKQNIVSLKCSKFWPSMLFFSTLPPCKIFITTFNHRNFVKNHPIYMRNDILSILNQNIVYLNFSKILDLTPL